MDLKSRIIWVLRYLSIITQAINIICIEVKHYENENEKTIMLYYIIKLMTLKYNHQVLVI